MFKLRYMRKMATLPDSQDGWEGPTQASEKRTIWRKSNVCNHFLPFVLYSSEKKSKCLFLASKNHQSWILCTGKCCVKVCRVCFQKSRENSKLMQYIFASTGHAKGKNAHVTKGILFVIQIPSNEWFWDEMKKQKFFLMCNSGCDPKKHRMSCLRKRIPEWFVPRESTWFVADCFLYKIFSLISKHTLVTHLC